MKERPPWDEYFMEFAKVAKKRSTCLRRQVGCVLVKNKQILTTGYNGAPTGIKHCEEVGCLREKLEVPEGERHEICRGLHAEQNCIIQAALHGISTDGATLYSTTQPCSICARMIINAGITRIIFIGEYPDKLALELLKEAKISITKIPPPRGEGNDIL